MINEFKLRLQQVKFSINYTNSITFTLDRRFGST